MSRLCSIALVLSLVAPVFTEAQQAGHVAHVGELVADPMLRQTFRQGLRELGYFEGRNITFESRGVEGQLGRLTDLAADLVRLRVDPKEPVATVELRAIQAAARELNVATETFEVGERLDEVLTAIRKVRADALIVVYTARTARERTRIVEFTIANRIPLMSEGREFTEAGGLMTYGPKMIDLYRRAAVYADKILKGAKPADLPIEQP